METGWLFLGWCNVQTPFYPLYNPQKVILNRVILFPYISTSQSIRWTKGKIPFIVFSLLVSLDLVNVSIQRNTSCRCHGWRKPWDNETLLCISHYVTSGFLRLNHVITIFALDHNLSHVEQWNRKFMRREKGVHTTLHLLLTNCL